jgi:carbon monoxide dehydrogenase subunit G
VERVWKFLIDPEQVVTCLPGAELTKIEDPRTFLGQMKVKVGPVTVAYHGRVKLTEVDDASHIVKMFGEGTEKGGAGSAKMTMESTVSESNGGSLVKVKSKVDLAGKIVQFGRGMVKGVAGQMFKQFGENLKAALETPEAAPAPAEPAAASAAAPAPEPGAAAPGTTRVSTDKPTAPLVVRPRAKPAEPVRIVPMIFRALFEPILRFFRRLLGRQ